MVMKDLYFLEMKFQLFNAAVRLNWWETSLTPCICICLMMPTYNSGAQAHLYDT